MGIATVHQFGGTFPLMSVGRCFFVGREPTKKWGPLKVYDRAKANEIAVKAIQSFGITRIDDGDRLVGGMSGGERQSLAIARAVHFGARVLILDEPTAALGVKQASHVLRIVLEAKRRGLAVIFITHQVTHAMAVGDHFAVLIRGAVAANFRKGEKTREELTDLMAGGEALADLGAEIESYMETHEGHPPPVSHCLAWTGLSRPQPTGADPSSQIGAGPRPPSDTLPRQRGAQHEDRPRPVHAPPPLPRGASLQGRRARLRVDRAQPARRLPRVVQGAARLPRPDQGLQEGAEGRQRRHRLAPADVPLGLERRGRAAGGGQALEARHRDRRRARRRHDELRVRPRPAPGQGLLLLLPHRLDDRGLRGRLVALDGGAGAGLREGGHQPPCRAAPRGLVRDDPAGARHHPHRQLEAGQVPLLRAAHLLLRRRHQGDAARERRCARACPCRRHLQPQGQFRPALHPEPAGHAGAGAPAPRTSARARCRGTTSSARSPRSASTGS